jgi:hypothetical protein
MSRFAKGAAVGGIIGVFVAAAAIALAGTGVGGIFNLGQENTVNAQTSLKGAVAGNAQLRVENGSSGVGLFGISSTGKGVYGKHTAATGGEPGVQGESASAAAAGVVGKNTAGGPGLSALVSAGTPPLAVNSQARVANLNADQVDGKSSSAFLPSSGDVVLWYSPYDYVGAPGMQIDHYYGPAVTAYYAQEFGSLMMPLDQPQSIFGTTLKVKAVTVCFQAQGAQITGTHLMYGQSGQATVLYEDAFVHSASDPTCYDVAPATPTVVPGSLFLALDVQFYSTLETHINLFSVRTRLGT